MIDVKKYVPVADWLSSYKKDDLRGDISAGLTVGVMLIPQGMAYSMIAGLPPIYGLYASTIPLILYAIFGTSRQLAVGPVAMISLLVAAGVGNLVKTGSEEYIALAILLALMVGIFQFLLGIFRLGFLVNFLSHPVISGFTSAAALIIGLSQLKHLLGLDIPRSKYIHTILINAFQNIADVSILTLIVGITGIIIILGIRKINRAIPGPLLAVIFGILIVWSTGWHEEGVKIVGVVPEGLPPFSIPNLNLKNIESLLPIAVAITLVGFMESIAVAKAIQAKHKNYKVDSNQELIGLGIANIGGAMFSAFPTTGGFSRTAVNDQAGARTGLASIISALLIGLTLIFLTPLFYYLPKAILASVIMVAVFGLIDIKEVIHLWKTDKNDFVLLMISFVVTLTVGIEEGILSGVILSLAVILYKSTTPHIAILGRIKGTRKFLNVNRFTDAEQRKDVLIVRFDDRLYFANVNFFKEKMENLIHKGMGRTAIQAIYALCIKYD
jgi:SulP family sulfate permease